MPMLFSKLFKPILVSITCVIYDLISFFLILYFQNDLSFAAAVKGIHFIGEATDKFGNVYFLFSILHKFLI